MEDNNNVTVDTDPEDKRMFTLKKWNAVAMWSWDVDCDTCAICRVHVMDSCLRCQAENTVEAKSPTAEDIVQQKLKDTRGSILTQQQPECVVVWGNCNHSFHYCCMSLWVKQSNRCPLCQQVWSVQRMGK